MDFAPDARPVDCLNEPAPAQILRLTDSVRFPVTRRFINIIHRAGPKPPMIDICLCTCNPRTEVLGLVLQSLARQTYSRSDFRLVVVDNASRPPIPDALVAPLRTMGICARVIYENRPGVFHARNRAMNATDGELLLWIDDDTELSSNYLAVCRSIADNNPDIGCFGGKLLLPRTLRFPDWSQPLHVYLAVVDRGDSIITRRANHWGPWEPPTAGAIVRRSVITQYLEFISNLPDDFVIGQVGTRQLLRGEDSLLMRMADRAGLACSYQPSLKLVHHIDMRRFRVIYLLKLLYGYGRSFVILEGLLGTPHPPMSPQEAWRFFWNIKKRDECANVQTFLAMKAWNLGFINQRRRQLSS